MKNFQICEATKRRRTNEKKNMIKFAGVFFPPRFHLRIQRFWFRHFVAAFWAQKCLFIITKQFFFSSWFVCVCVQNMFFKVYIGCGCTWLRPYLEQRETQNKNDGRGSKSTKKLHRCFFFLALLACLQYVHVRLNLALFFVFRWIFSLFFGYFFWMCVWELFKSHLDFECLGWHSWFNIVFFFFIRSTIDITLFI